jgi:hypothetical protein
MAGNRTLRPEEPPLTRGAATFTPLGSGVQGTVDPEAAIRAEENLAQHETRSAMDRADLLRAGADLGMSASAAQKLLTADPQGFAEEVAQAARERRGNFENEMAKRREDGTAFASFRADNLGEMSETMTPQELARYVQIGMPQDFQRDLIPMFRPPAEDGYIDTWEYIPKVVADRWHREYGYRIIPEAPLRPPPTIPCGMRTARGTICTTKFYRPDDPDIDLHQRAKHRLEYAARERMIARRQWEQDREDRQVALTRQEQRDEAILQLLRREPPAVPTEQERA